MRNPNGPGHDEYPDPEESYHTPAQPPAPLDDEYPDPVLPPSSPHRDNPPQPPGEHPQRSREWSQQAQAAQAKASQIGQQVSQKLSDRVPEWTASAKKYSDDVNKRSAQQAAEVNAKVQKTWREADAKSRKQLLGRPAVVVWAQGIVLIAGVAAFFATLAASNRFLRAPSYWVNQISNQDTSILAEIDEGLVDIGDQVQEGALAAGQGLAVAPLFLAFPILVFYLLAILAMWTRMPRARTLSSVLAIIGVLLAFIGAAPYMRPVIPFYAQGLYAIAAILGIVAMALMLIPASNSWVELKRGPRPQANDAYPAPDAADISGLQYAAMDPDQPVPPPQRRKPPEDY